MTEPVETRELTFVFSVTVKRTVNVDVNFKYNEVDIQCPYCPIDESLLPEGFELTEVDFTEVALGKCYSDGIYEVWCEEGNLMVNDAGEIDSLERYIMGEGYRA